MKIFLRILGMLGIGAFLWLVWLVCGALGPSTIIIENTGPEATTLRLTDADPTVTVWSGELKPRAKKRVMVWFKYEGDPELHCRDSSSSGVAYMGYVTFGMLVDARIAVTGCDNIDVKIRH